MDERLGNGNIYVKKCLTIKRASGGYEDAPGHVVRGQVHEEQIPLDLKSEMTEDELLDGVTQEDLNQIVSRNPRLGALFGGQASQSSEGDADYEDVPLAPSGAEKFAGNRQGKYAAFKRVGMLVDPKTGESIKFRHLVTTGMVELTDEQSGELIETLSSQEFENFVNNSEYTVL